MARFSSLCLALALAGCPGPVDPNRELTEVSCTLGTVDDAGAFHLLEAGADLELILGFQGFLLLITHLGSEDMDSNATATTSLEMEGHEPSGGSQPALSFSNGVSSELLFFLPSSNVAAYVGNSAALAVRLEDQDHFCIATATVTLVDEDECIHVDGPDVCPGDTGDTGDGS